MPQRVTDAAGLRPVTRTAGRPGRAAIQAVGPKAPASQPHWRSRRQRPSRIARKWPRSPARSASIPSRIDVVAALFYAALSRSLLRAATGNGRADDKLVGMLQVLLKALDPSELRISGPDGGPIPIAAVVANVQSALGMRPTTAELPDAQT